MRMQWLLGCLLVVAGCRRFHGRASAGGGSAGAQVVPSNDDERTLYAMGLVLGRRVTEFNLTPRELAVVQRGMADQVLGHPPAVSLEQFGPRIQQLVEAREARASVAAHARGAQFLEQAVHEPGAQRLPSGMVYRELQAGTGAQPGPSDEVSVMYRGTLPDGTQFDSSYDRGQPATFQLNRVIPCWTEGVGRMHVGGRARLVCPPNMAYGERAQPRIPAGSTLVFDVELRDVHPQAPPPTPTQTFSSPADGGR